MMTLSQPQTTSSTLFGEYPTTTSMMKCLIVDDEKIAREIIKTYLAKLPYIELVGECRDAVQALSILQKETVDLLILDIEMPNLSGIELVKSFSQQPLVIFSTAYPQYALEGFELDVVDYLLKPVRFSRFLQAVNRVSQRLKAQRLTDATMMPELPVTNEQSYIILRADHKIYKVAYNDIAYIQSMKEYAAFYLHSGGKILALKALRQLEKELPEQQFLRVHRSYIIPIAGVTAVNRQSVQLGSVKLPVGGHYWQTIRDRLIN